jgi:hypothetical protein
MSVDAFVEALQKTRDRHTEDFADSEQRGHSNWPSRLNLLPMPRRESERDHVLLAETSGLPQLADSFSQTVKEFRLIWHPRVCRVPRAETPRAD